MPKREFFLAPDRMWIFLRPESANGTEEEAKATPQNGYVVRKLNATDGVEVAERKLVTHFEKKCAECTNSLDKNRSQIKMWAKVVGSGN
jgi:hypothetical protein